MASTDLTIWSLSLMKEVCDRWEQDIHDTRDTLQGNSIFVNLVDLGFGETACPGLGNGWMNEWMDCMAWDG